MDHRQIGHHQENEKYPKEGVKLAVMYLIRDLYLQYIKTSHNSTIKIQMILKMGLNRHFSKYNMQMGTKHMKICSTPVEM